MFHLLKRSLFLVTALSILVLALAACAAQPVTPAEPAAEGDSAAASDASAATGEKSRLVIAQTVDVQGLEPSEVNSRAEANIFHHMYATLYEIIETGEIVPYLANSYKVSDDGKEWTFTLNEGLTCHDGEALTAEDVVYTFERAADDANAFTGNTAGFVLDLSLIHI